jgi:hypothetical protein
MPKKKREKETKRKECQTDEITSSRTSHIDHPTMDLADTGSRSAWWWRSTCPLFDMRCLYTQHVQPRHEGQIYTARGDLNQKFQQNHISHHDSLLTTYYIYEHIFPEPRRVKPLPGNSAHLTVLRTSQRIIQPAGVALRQFRARLFRAAFNPVLSGILSNSSFPDETQAAVSRCKSTTRLGQPRP